MVDIRNSIVLRIVLNNIAEETIETISDKILDLLQRQIEKDVYLDNTKYFRTGEFLEAFNWEKIKKVTTGLVRELVYDHSGMSFNPDSWTHGSPIDGWGDATKYLVQILNRDTRASGLFISRIDEVKPYWDNTIKKLFNRRKITIWTNTEIKKVARRYGFKAIKIG